MAGSGHASKTLALIPITFRGNIHRHKISNYVLKKYLIFSKYLWPPKS